MLVEGKWTAEWHPVQAKDEKGGFVRQVSSFRNWVTPDGSAGPTGESGFAAEAERYHLYVALICPWASRSPFELRVIPRREAAGFAEDEAGAAMIRTALRVLAARFDGPPELNLWVRTAPRGADEFGWHVDIAPRLTIKAGFELGTGVDINIYPPERAASDLREALED